MDFNAYVFLISLVLVSLPGAFFPAYFALGNTLRLVGGLLYALVLYLAFMERCSTTAIFMTSTTRP